MFKEAISPDLQSNLAILSKERFVKPFYLAGGTACSLYLGHRFSFDLDFFTEKDFSIKTIIERLKKLGKLGIENEVKNTFVGKFRGARISFFKYQYLPIDKLNNFQGIKVAGLKDIVCMKLDAISSRGRKRDFVDLYFIFKEMFSLDEAFTFFERKFTGVNYNLVHIVRSLSYFEDADKDEMPQMIKKVSWEEIKKYFLQEVKRITDEFIHKKKR